jgi:hypothetical protein
VWKQKLPFAELYLENNFETEYVRQRGPLKKNITEPVVAFCKTFKIKKSTLFMGEAGEVQHTQLIGPGFE